MKTPPAPKPRISYAPQIKGMKANSYLFLEGASASSIRAIVCRIKKATGRKYTTQKAEEKPFGVHVWRLT